MNDAVFLSFVNTVIGHCEIIQILIENGSKKNHANKYGQTALIRAVSANQKLAVQLLLELGCDPSRTDNEDNNLLMIAALAQSREMLIYLLSIRYVRLQFVFCV